MKRLFLLLSSLVLLSCTSGAKKDASADGAKGESEKFSGQMQNMAQDVKKLLPYLYDRDAFHDPKNHDAIKQALKQFSQVATHIKPEAGKKFLGDDLLLESRDLKEQPYDGIFGTVWVTCSVPAAKPSLRPGRNGNQAPKQISTTCSFVVDVGKH